ncbi:MAG: recombination protein RecR [Luteibaculaceae bacterium]|jgi:recombination protein RecR
MSGSSEILENLVDQFAGLPGIGRKTALRFALHLLKKGEQELIDFSSSIQALNQIQYCATCFNISDLNTCSICASHHRSNQQLMVVENIKDILTLESTGQFFGKYHVLGGVISPLDGIGPEELNISELLLRVDSDSEIEEIIFALPTTMEGDTTGFYLYKKIQDKIAKITHLAKGVAIGDSIEYTDEITLGRSIVNRVPFDGSN